MANAIEDLKKENDGLDVWNHIFEASKVGFSAVNQELVPLFKWFGIYAQKPKEDGYYMMRIKIPGGQLTAEQTFKLQDLANRFSDGVCDITTRQAVQVHWLRIENIPTIVEELKEVDMDVYGGCGDIARNITGCPLAGLIADEHFDASPELKEIDEELNRNREYSNLPRKYKMSITGCSHWCSQPDINCVSLVGVKHPETGELGYTLKVGGGLSTKPMIAKNFPVFVTRKQAKDLVLAVTAVYRDHGFRDKRQKARIKFLVEDWGVEKFLTETEKVLGYKLTRVPEIRTMETGAKEYFPSPADSHHDHLGVTKLKNGKYALGISFISGRARYPDFTNVAKLAEEFSTSSEIRTTNKQNLIIINIPADQIDACKAKAAEYKLKTEFSPFTNLGVACTGTEYCNLAIVETKARAKDLFDYLDTEFPEFSENLMISVTGCPNNCAQYSIADIGLVGAKLRNEAGEMEDAFRITLGGRLGDEAQFGQALKNRYLHKDIHLTLKKLFNFYQENKSLDELFRHFVDRLGLERIEEALA